MVNELFLMIKGIASSGHSANGRGALSSREVNEVSRYQDQFDSGVAGHPELVEFQDGTLTKRDRGGED